MIKQELEYRALKLIEQQPQLTQRQLALELDVSLGKAHYVLKSLVDIGLVKYGNFKHSNNKFGYIYLLTPKGIVEKVEITKRFLARKQNDYERLRQEIEQLRQEVSEQK